MTFVPIDYQRGDINANDFALMLESMKINNPQSQLNLPDSHNILGMIVQMGYFKNLGGDDVIISGNCDLIKLLEANFPEVAQYDWPGKSDTDRGKVDLSKLKDLLEPYLMGDKPLPCQLRNSEQPAQ